MMRVRKEKAGMVDEPSEQELTSAESRRASLESRLAAARESEAQRTRSGQQGADAGYRLGNRVLAELLGGMVGGAAVGVAIDWLVGRGSHWGLMVMLFLGIVVAFRNIIRISNRPSE
jgi:ATP synthase protein I